MIITPYSGRSRGDKEPSRQSKKVEGAAVQRPARTKPLQYSTCFICLCSCSSVGRARDLGLVRLYGRAALLGSTINHGVVGPIPTRGTMLVDRDEYDGFATIIPIRIFLVPVYT